MIDASRPEGDQTGFAETGRAETPSPFNGPDRPRFSFGVSLFAATLLLTALGVLLWLSSNSPKLDRFEDPERALDLMASRTMEAQDGLLLAPDWQQRVTEWTAGSNEVERAQAIQWYQELVAATASPAAKLRLAILQAESGHPSEALAAATNWADEDAPLSLYAAFIDAAYGNGSLTSEREVELQSALAEVLPAGWFYNHLAAALAERAGDVALGATVREQMHARGARIQGFSQLLTGLELLGLIGGSLMVLRFAWLGVRRVDGLRLHQPGVPPPWPGGIGTAVLLRGGALGAVLSLAFISMAPAENVSLRAVAIPMANLPLLGMAYYYLLRPSGLNFLTGFGLQIQWRQVGRLAGVVLAVVAAGLWGEWVMGRVAESLHLANHWTEWFDPDLVWASGSVLTISLLEYVVFAPIFEELAFRGILYAILRRRLNPLPAALISAGIFALAHGYGLIGFISVLWSGVLWAWLYERTGSLIPGMIAHATNNLLVCLAVMALLR
ncbi:MAG: CPBP family intramembrane metalloprotease [Nitrospiraceae bacterium]|nr:CPBP family intramembrane metalloprotease [Nitrospiraceae bacterium]